MAGERLLIVDDESAVRDLLSTFCTSQGYIVDTAPDGEAALDALSGADHALCILDLRLPGMSGIEVLRRARELAPDCEVIILTGYADVESAVAALRLGAYDYLQKPLADLERLRNVVARALERRRLAERNEQLIRDLRAANEEIERQRHQELAYIRQIGQALASALDVCEIVQVLVDAVDNSIPCDAVAALLPFGGAEGRSLALLRGHGEISPAARHELLGALVRLLPDECLPDNPRIEVRLADGGTIYEDDISPYADGQDATSWGWTEQGLLSARGQVEGVMMIARREAVPADEDDLGVFGILVSQGSAAVSNSRLFARTRELAVRDGLTGLYNHRHFFHLLEAEISRSERHGMDLAVIMIDVDGGANRGLKVINDTLGHQAGDALLRSVATMLREMVRKADVVARYGGDEFAILAPQTPRQQALALARRVRLRVRDTEFNVCDRPTRLTVSIGTAVFRPGMQDDASAVVSRADRALYRAKERGGDRVCCDETT